MGRLFVLLVVGSFFLSTALRGFDVTAEAGDEHHEHQGITDADPSQAGHHHGDADDHHQKPGDDCHHHVVHCGCGSGPSAPPPSLKELMPPASCSLTPLPFLEPHQEVSARQLFHIPIA